MENDIKRAERDNDLIYHQIPPSLTSLQPITPATMVKSDVPSTLTDPQGVIQRDGVIFGELLAWGARKAIGLRFPFRAETLFMDLSPQTSITTGRIASYPMKLLHSQRK